MNTASPRRALVVGATGIAGQTVMWAGRHNTDTAATTELATSPVIIALG